MTLRLSVAVAAAAALLGLHASSASVPNATARAELLEVDSRDDAQVSRAWILEQQTKKSTSGSTAIETPVITAPAPKPWTPVERDPLRPANGAGLPHTTPVVKRPTPVPAKPQETAATASSSSGSDARALEHAAAPPVPHELPQTASAVVPPVTEKPTESPAPTPVKPHEAPVASSSSGSAAVPSTDAPTPSVSHHNHPGDDADEPHAPVVEQPETGTPTETPVPAPETPDETPATASSSSDSDDHAVADEPESPADVAESLPDSPVPVHHSPPSSPIDNHPTPAPPSKEASPPPVTRDPKPASTPPSAAEDPLASPEPIRRPPKRLR